MYIYEGKNPLSVPADLKDLFQPLYDAGARIISNSWGSENVNNYDGQAQEVDQFMYDHPDSLVLFAAGNSGVDTGTLNSLYATVGAPSTCKVSS